MSGRSDWVSTTGEDLFALTRQTQSDQAYSGRAGLTYVFDSGVAPYVAYSTSFFPNLGVDPSGAFFKPTTGKQTEVGVKYQPQGTRSFIAAAVFDLTQDGGLVTTGTGVTVQRGEIQSRGFELQALASLGGGFDITSSYTYLDMVTKQAADDSLIGKFPSGNPPHTATLWANYALPLAGPFAGLSVGGGARYMSWSYGDDANTFKNSSVTLIDAALKYDFGQAMKELKGLQFQVNAKNLFNLHYTTCQVGYCYRGAPLTVIATLGYRVVNQLAPEKPGYPVNMSYPNRWRRRLTRQVVGADFNQGGPAGQAVDQAEQLNPHDRTPLLIICRILGPQSFRPFSRDRENGFVGERRDVVGTDRTKLPHAGVRRISLKTPRNIRGAPSRSPLTGSGRSRHS
ncbi:hypothetical protein ACVWXQ_006748 [Bradyrhizobium sp. S3.14.4]